MNFFHQYVLRRHAPYKTRIDAIRDAGFTHAFLWWDQNDPERFEQPSICAAAGWRSRPRHLQFAGINNMWLG